MTILVCFLRRSRLAKSVRFFICCCLSRWKNFDAKAQRRKELRGKSRLLVYNFLIDLYFSGLLSLEGIELSLYDDRIPTRRTVV
jgi:hypothetical protein